MCFFLPVTKVNWTYAFFYLCFVLFVRCHYCFRQFSVQLLFSAVSTISYCVVVVDFVIKLQTKKKHAIQKKTAHTHTHLPAMAILMHANGMNNIDICDLL